MGNGILESIDLQALPTGNSGTYSTAPIPQGPPLDQATADKLFKMGIQTPAQLNALVSLTSGNNAQRIIPSGKTSPHMTILTPQDEAKFRQWAQHDVKNIQPDDPKATYDMRGYWKALQTGDPRARPVIDSTGKASFPTKWRTPDYKEPEVNIPLDEYQNGEFHPTAKPAKREVVPDNGMWFDTNDLLDGDHTPTGKLASDKAYAAQVYNKWMQEQQMYNSLANRIQPTKPAYDPYIERQKQIQLGAVPNQ